MKVWYKWFSMHGQVVKTGKTGLSLWVKMSQVGLALTHKELKELRVYARFLSIINTLTMSQKQYHCNSKL